MKLPIPIVIKRHGRVNVVRYDLLPGGMKRRILTKILPSIEQNEIVYAGDPRGFAGLALAYACQAYGKKAVVFYPEGTGFPKVYDDTLAHPSVEAKIVKAENQAALYEDALAYARQSPDRYIFPIGFCSDAFESALVQHIRELPVEVPPREVWTLAGSGCLARCLVRAWPEAEIHAVSMGFGHVQLDGVKHVYQAHELPHEQATLRPAFNSAAYYDAKVWRFVQAHARDGALVMNVA